MRLNFILIAIVIVLVSGCAVDPSRPKGTKLEIIDVTKVSFVSRGVANNDKLSKKSEENTGCYKRRTAKIQYRQLLP